MSSMTLRFLERIVFCSFDFLALPLLTIYLTSVTGINHRSHDPKDSSSPKKISQPHLGEAYYADAI